MQDKDQQEEQTDIAAALGAAFEAYEKDAEAVEVEQPEDAEPIEASGEELEEDLHQNEESEETEAPTDVEDSDALDLPVSWSETTREHWANLPREVQEFILRRERDFEQGVQQKAQEAARYRRALSAVDSVFAQYPEIEDRINSSGVSKADYIRSLMQMASVYERDPVTCARQILQSAGVDPAQLIQRETASNSDPRIEQLQSELMQMRQAQMQQQQAQQQASYQSLVSAVQSWAEETDANGAKLRPYAQDVADHMMALTSVIRQQKPSAAPYEVMQEAYEQAVRANPQVWQRTQQAQRATAEREKARRAKAAGSSISGRAGSSTNSVPPSDLRAQLEQALG